MRVAIIGHAASPARGSEPGLAWNWAWHLSRHHEVWLVTYPEFRDEVEAAMAAEPNPNLTIVWAENNPAFDPWTPRGTSTGPRFKAHYFLWLGHVERRVRELVRQHAIDVVHHVGLNTVSAPPRLWRVGAPFVWGPVGGGQLAPAAFRQYYGREWRREQSRRLRIGLVGRSAGLRKAVRHASYLLANNRETEHLLLRAGADRERLLLMGDNGLRPEAIRCKPRRENSRTGLKLLWAGRLEARKALPILIDALALIRQSEPEVDVEVVVAGEGPQRADWERHALAAGVADKVTFLGFVPYLRMEMLFDEADALAFTSLQDSGGSILTEALGAGLPVIMLDHQGAAILPDSAVLKIKLRCPEATIRGLAEALVALARNPGQLRSLTAATADAAREFDWSRRAAVMSGIYARLATTARQPAAATPL